MTRGLLQFPFPSNGKTHSKSREHRSAEVEVRTVSIPFKRENAFQVEDEFKLDAATYLFPFPSNGKRHSKDDTLSCNPQAQPCFNSLQTGKRIPSLPARKMMTTCLSNLFQFPSNGKTHSKFFYRKHVCIGSGGFNSLQTGKRIPRNRLPTQRL